MLGVQSVSPQQTFIVTSNHGNIELSSIGIAFYNLHGCEYGGGTNLFNTNLIHESIESFTTLTPGSYTSTDQSNYSLCGLYGGESSGSCSNGFDSTQSIKFTYNFYAGESRPTSVCLSNPFGGSSGVEHLGNYENGAVHVQVHLHVDLLQAILILYRRICYLYLVLSELMVVI